MLSDGSRECTCIEISLKHPDCVCDRKHFNNFLWATVTVFQVRSFELLISIYVYEFNSSISVVLLI